MGVLSTAVANLDAQLHGDLETALHLAAESESDALAMVEILLSRGRPELHVDRRGRSPMHYAALAGHGRVVRVLLAYGSDVFEAEQRRSDGDAAWALGVLVNQPDFS